jgi:hypothetical protein
MLKRYLILTLILTTLLTLSISIFAQTKQQMRGITPAPRPLDLGPPKVVSFKINNGVKTTTSRTVTLNNVTERATLFCASERSDLQGAYWKNMHSAPQFILSTGNGTKTVYFQVADPQGRKSPIVSDTINLSMVPTATKSPRKTFTINGKDFYNTATLYGYNSYAHKKSWNADCRIVPGGKTEVYVGIEVWTGQLNNLIGSTCDFSLFEGTLKNNFIYKDFVPGNKWSSDWNKASTSLTKKPSAGSTSTNFKYHGWAEPNQYTCMAITSITLEGPADLSWDRAFH